MSSELKKVALNVAKIWAKVIDLDLEGKQIHIIVSETEHKHASAQVRVFIDGKEIPEWLEEDAISLGDFDTIEITLFKLKNPHLTPKWVQTQYFLSSILHELLHIRYPEWEETEILDEEARITGKFMESLEKRYRLQSAHAQ